MRLTVLLPSLVVFEEEGDQKKILMPWNANAELASLHSLPMQLNSPFSLFF